MATLTLKQVPESLLNELREVAERERRSVNQQAIYLLEEAVKLRKTSFSERLSEFYQKVGSDREELEEDAFENVRSHDPGRDVEL